MAEEENNEEKETEITFTVYPTNSGHLDPHFLVSCRRDLVRL